MKMSCSQQKKLITPLSHWTVESFFAKQLSNFFIAKFESEFKRPINQRQFSARIQLEKIIRNKDKGLFLLSSSCFYDDTDGLATLKAIIMVNTVE